MGHLEFKNVLDIINHRIEHNVADNNILVYSLVLTIV